MYMCVCIHTQTVCTVIAHVLSLKCKHFLSFACFLISLHKVFSTLCIHYFMETNFHIYTKSIVFFSYFYWNIVESLLYNKKVTQLYIYMYMYIYIYTHILLHVLFQYGLLQHVEYSSLCYSVGHCFLSILYIPVCIC